MHHLKKLLADFVRQHIGSLPKHYDKRYDISASRQASLRSLGISVTGSDIVERNIGLKTKLFAAWGCAGNLNREFDLARFYVTNWGRVRPDDSTLLAHIASVKAALATATPDWRHCTLAGVPGWSNLASTVNPNRAASFDVRQGT